MKFLKQIFLSLVFLAFSLSVYAQNGDVFTATADLPKQVDNFIAAKTPENKEAVSKFADKLQRSVFPQEQLENIVAMMNLYVKKRANPSPHVVNLIKTISAFWDKNRASDFTTWHTYMMELMGQSNIAVSRINEVVVFTYNLLVHNSLEMIGNKNWYLSSSKYKMNFQFKGKGDDIITVTCEGTDLRCRERDDSTLVIYSTSGVYDAVNHVWKGKNGKVDWRRGNLSPDSIYAELSDYTIETKGDHYEAGNILFYNKKYFKTAIKGSLEDKVVLTGTGAKARYPQFKSSDADLVITNLIEGVDYKGGYAQNGVIFSGAALNDSLGLAHLIFKHNGKPLIDAATLSVVFGSRKLESKSARITIYVGDTVIIHPGVKLKYNADTEELILFKSTSGMEQVKYTDYYHNLFIDANQIEWQREDTLLFFATRPAAPYDYALFQSDEYFSMSDYSEMQGTASIHPLILIRKYLNEDLGGDIRLYSFKGLQKFIQTVYGTTLSETQVHQMLLRLAYNEFIGYDVQAKRIYRVNQKLYDWIGMSTGEKDYNSISMKSQMQGNRDFINAVLNLNDNKLTVFNILPFDISQRRRVRITPDSSMDISKRLSIDFSGKIQAGLVDFYGKKFNFDYSKFMINIEKADSMAILTLGKTEDGKKNKLDSVRSVLENIVGILNIDRTTNKSGYRKGVTTADNFYPVLATTDTSYVFYDKLVSKEYDREKFHMTVYPFKLDSLNYMRLNGVKAKGEFVSGIFPVLNVTLTVQPDYSLGFVLPTPKEGMDLFNGKGVFHNTVTLNAKGLIGDGEINYLTSTSRSKMFSFFPDSVSGGCYYVDIQGVKANQIGQVKGVKAEYPNVFSDTAYIYWMPHQDIFSSVTSDTTLKIYDKTIAFNGKLDLTPTKMVAQGEMLFNGDGLFSDKFLLRNSTFDADSASLCNFDENFPGDSTGHFYTGRYDAKYDVVAKYAQFVTSGDSSFVYFPQHKYKQKMDFFEYNLDKKYFEFGKDLSHYDKKLIAKSEEEFVKLKASQSGSGKYKPLLAGATMVSFKDTLTFPAQSVSYDNSKGLINVYEPGIIHIVDTKIDPSGIIKINRGGDIDKFENAYITANFDSLYHKIINTTVKIRDKYYFKAKGGQYEYVNESKEISYLNLDSLEIRRVKLDTAAAAPKVRVSFGIGSVNPEENFMLSTQYAFSGKYSFMGLTKGITFNGFAYIRQNCDTTVMPFKFEGNLDPDHIVFPISERVMDTAKNRLFTGFFQDVNSGKVYPVFMGRKVNPADLPVLDANRGLDYLVSKNLYEVAVPKRLRDSTVNENYVAFLQNDCSIYGEGNINTNVNVEPLQVVTKGSMTYSRDFQSVSLNTLATVNLLIKQDLIKLMGENIANVEDMTPLNLADTNIMRKLNMLCGRDTLARIMKDYTATGSISKMPASLSKTFVFADLAMKYDTLAAAYRSLGKIGVAYIGDRQVNRYVTGNVEIRPNKRKGDQITVYLEPEKGHWYYFNYKGGILSCLSSVDEFNDKIIKTKEKDRSFKTKGVDYQYIVANDEDKTKFIRSLTNSVPVVRDNDLDDFEKNIESENQGGEIPDNEVHDGGETPQQPAPQQPNKAEEEEEQDFIDE